MPKTLKDLLFEFSQQRGIPHLCDFTRLTFTLLPAQLKDLNDIFYHAMGEENLDVISKCMKYGVKPEQMEVYPIHIAAKKGDVDSIQFLVKECKADVNQLGWLNSTPLSLAATYGKADAFKCLVELGATYNKPLKSVDSTSCTLLDIAIIYAIISEDTTNKNGCREIAKYLLVEKKMIAPEEPPSYLMSDMMSGIISKESFIATVQDLQKEIASESQEGAQDADLDSLCDQMPHGQESMQDQDSGASAGGIGHSIESGLGGESSDHHSDLE